jgi:hypothetical protein
MAAAAVVVVVVLVADGFVAVVGSSWRRPIRGTRKQKKDGRNERTEAVAPSSALVCFGSLATRKECQVGKRTGSDCGKQEKKINKHKMRETQGP